MEELVVGPKEQTHIVKGKRTKRQRLNSPIPFRIAGDYGNDRNALDSNSSNAAADENALDSSAATEDEEEMANCLILLAQGHFRDSPIPRDEFTAEPFRFSSKRYLEKVGIYVYDCKTCGRTFPSFQALGGHRASHKKPKAEEKKSLVLLSDDDYYYDEPNNNNNNNNSLSLQLSHKGLFGSTTTMANKFKVHECSICGSEFASGQALGGHMRRHRGGPLSTNNDMALALSPLNAIKMDSEEEIKQPNSALSLDLNLPAPEELGFVASKQQKSALVLSNAPTLVDCHY